jgi:hypothetical protein
MTKMNARSTGFWAATQSGDKELTGLGLLERQRVKVWLGKVFTQSWDGSAFDQSAWGVDT